MTYCVGLLLEAGIVMLSDTRTNAGFDNIACYRKMFVFEASGERVVTILTAGNLSVTQTVIAKLRQEIAREDPETSIMLAPSMLQVAELVGRTLNDVYVDVDKRMERTDVSASASMLLAGQRLGGLPRLFLIYREGNFIEATDDTPYLQIGEHKYGKPILDRVVNPATSLEDGRKAVLISMDSTLRSNLSVGMPLDLLTIRRNEYRVATRERIEPGESDLRGDVRGLEQGAAAGVCEPSLGDEAHPVGKAGKTWAGRRLESGWRLYARSRDEPALVEGLVLADEGVGDGDEASAGGDDGDLGRLSGVAHGAIGRFEARIAAGGDHAGDVEGGAQARPSAGDRVAPGQGAALVGMRRHAGEAGGGLAVETAAARACRR